MHFSTSISTHVNEINHERQGSSSNTNGAPMDGGLLRAAISDNLLNLSYPPSFTDIEPDALLNLRELPPIGEEQRARQSNDPPSCREVQLMDNRLLEAAISGNPSEMKKMFLRDPNILLRTTSQGSTCLHISSILGHQNFSMTVLALNQSLLSILNSYRETPLIVAVKSGHVDLATTLLQMYDKNFSEMILNSDINGDTALHHAIHHGHRDFALQLIRKKPELSQRVNHYNESPMYIAVMRGFDDVFELLLGTPDSSHKGAYDDNALHAAVRNENLGEYTR